MKGFLIFLLGVIVGIGGGYVLFVYDGGVIPQAGELKLPLTDHLLSTLKSGDQVVLLEGKFGYTLHRLNAPDAAALTAPGGSPADAEPTGESPPGLRDKLAAWGALESDVYQVSEVRRDHVVLRQSGTQTHIPAAQISAIVVEASQPATAPASPQNKR